MLARALVAFDRLRLRPEEPSLVEELQSLLASGDQLDLESKHAGGAHHASVSLADGVGVQLPVEQPAVGLALSEALRWRGRHDEALATLAALPTTAATLLAQAELLSVREAHARVVGLGSVEVTDDVTAMYAVVRAAALRESHRLDDAFDELDQVMAAESPPALQRLAVLERVRCMLRAGRIGAASRDLTGLLRDDPDDAEAHALLAHLRDDVSQTSEMVPAEVIEVRRREAELASLEAELLEAQVVLKALERELGEFNRQQLDLFSKRYARLDRLEADLAAARAEHEPTSSNKIRPDQPEEESRATREEFVAQILAPTPPPPPDDSLRALYKKLVKRLHPDHARDEADRSQRDHWMRQLTKAWADRDYETLRRIVTHAHDLSEHPASSGPTARRLVAVLRGIADQQAALRETVTKIEALHASPLGLMRDAAQFARAQGHDMLASLAADLDSQIAAKQRELRRLRKASRERASKTAGPVG
ncbi:MAG TPA: tetratricopeptide repeat protein [Mycobacteriales bacterium]|nr:tetratricopeptide repeat protein [Mycobacteriales bacterium]